MARLNLTLSDAARAAVDALTEDLSEYYSGLVLTHHAAVQTACHDVAKAGWTRGEVTAALELLAGSWALRPDVALHALRESLVDDEVQHRLKAVWRLDLVSWAARVTEAHTTAWVGPALLLLARVYWHNGALVRRWVERLPQPAHEVDTMRDLVVAHLAKKK